MIKYFKELLKTLKSIEKHLGYLRDCVQAPPTHRHHKKYIRTGHWNE